MKYVTALELRLRHPFHADGRCAGVTIGPRGSTARLLERHRSHLYASPGQITVLSPADEAGHPLLTRRPEKSLLFELRIAVEEFPLFTDLTDLRATPSPVFTNARLAPGAAELELVSRAALDPGAGAEAPARGAGGALAEVEIVLPPGGAGLPSPPVLQITFAPRSWRWAYYCVTDLADGAGDLEIVDASPVSPLLFGEANRTSLAEHPDPADPIAAQLAARFPGMRCVRFVSDEPVACREEPRKHLELRLDGHRVSSPLPNPSVWSFSRRQPPPPGSGPQDFLYQIIEYRAQPFPNP